MFNKSNENRFDLKKSIELIDAAIDGNTDAIEFLIKNGANANYVDEHGDTALSQAAFKGHVETTKKLLSYLSARYSKNRALILAAQAGHAEIIDLLLKEKAEVNVYLENYHTPLFQVITQNKMDAFKKLLVNADINLDQEDKEGVIPILLAAYNGHFEMIKLLVANKANFTIRNMDGKTALDMAVLNNKQEVVDYLNEILAKKSA
jgi:ankyrin repeat protein